MEVTRQDNYLTEDFGLSEICERFANLRFCSEAGKLYILQNSSCGM